MLRRHAHDRRRGGYTLMEAVVAATLVVIMLMGALGVIQRDTTLSRSILKTSNVELMAQEMLFQIERELAYAHGSEPETKLTATLASNTTDKITVASTLSFPDQGFLVIDRGEETEERIRYESFDESQTAFTKLTRGEHCTKASEHVPNDEIDVLWMGFAEPLENQENPQANLFDGIARMPIGDLYFRGDGMGFSYRIPVDPTGGTNYVDGDSITWGANIKGDSTLDGWVALYYEPKFTYDEAETGFDLNGDGDETDVYDVGQIRRHAWNRADPDALTEDIGMGPTAVIQERCNWGSDLDGDGFEDPMFLWDDRTRQLHIRLFLLGVASGQPVVRSVESSLFLRNEFEG